MQHTKTPHTRGFMVYQYFRFVLFHINNNEKVEQFYANGRKTERETNEERERDAVLLLHEIPGGCLLISEWTSLI